jgi:tRNA pseudouridine55 synthase
MVASSGPVTAGEGSVFLVDKPAGLTSFAVVQRVRRLLGIKKVGHAGTLDPFATGLLIVCAGRSATRHIEQFMDGGKTYLARLQLGVETETLDPEGAITATAAVPVLDQATIDACLDAHAGRQFQVPPSFSAVKHQGKPLYAYARLGVHIDKEARPVVIELLVCHGYDSARAQLDIEVRCSRGTYIRVLAADIGRSLGCGAHLISLRRTTSGPFTVQRSLPGEVLCDATGREQLLAGRMAIDEALRLVGPASVLAGAGGRPAV